MNETILADANIVKEWWPDCYITDDGMIFTPNFDDSGAMTTTGQEAYDAWLAGLTLPGPILHSSAK